METKIPLPQAGEKGFGINLQFMTSNLVYGTRILGTLMPSFVWLFSRIAATIRGNASALPLSV
jgi:hypothetical protein